VKKRSLSIIIIVCALSGCNRASEDTTEELPKEPSQLVTPSELRVVSSRVSSYALAEEASEAGSYAGSNEERIIAFTGADVKTFNQGTGELSFEELTFDQLRSRIYNYTLTFYLGEQELFRSATIGYDTVFIETNSIYDDLVFVMRDSQNRSLYLLDGFPGLDWVARFGGNVTASKQRREENAMKRKDEWELFINYFKEAGKLIE
jgi:hypothetical protein